MRGRGILREAAGRRRFTLELHAPSPDLRPFVTHLWEVAWDLTGEPPYRQENVPEPAVHLAMGEGRPQVHGVVTERFARVLEGRGRVLGVRFRPGGFAAFQDRPVSELTGRTVDARDLFGAAAGRLPPEVAPVEAFLRSRSPAADEPLPTARDVAERVAREREIRAVDDLAQAAGVHRRTLQRLFARYVGVSPKWVVQRHRLVEAVDRVDRGEAVDWGRLAVELGFYDQAHLINAFRALVGVTPAAYAEQVRGR